MGHTSFGGIHWVILNLVVAVGDRTLQRLMLAKDQSPVDISKTGITLLNNLLGLIPVCVVIWLKGEFHQAGAAFAGLDAKGILWICLSCVVGSGISYTGIWTQSLISAASFLVRINSNKFAIIFLDAFVL